MGAVSSSSSRSSFISNAAAFTSDVGLIQGSSGVMIPYVPRISIQYSKGLKGTSDSMTILDGNSVALNPDNVAFYVGGMESGKFKVPVEKARYGWVDTRVQTAGAILRNNNNISNGVVDATLKVTPRGAIFYGNGSQYRTTRVQDALSRAHIPVLVPTEVPVVDSKAQSLLVLFSGEHPDDRWLAVPSPDPFARHSGTCLLLGDKGNPSTVEHEMKIGDCIRLGSVGLVVSEVKYVDGREFKLNGQQLQYLKDEALAFDNANELATLAADEEEATKKLLLKKKVKQQQQLQKRLQPQQQHHQLSTDDDVVDVLGDLECVDADMTVFSTLIKSIDGHPPHPHPHIFQMNNLSNAAIHCDDVDNGGGGGGGDENVTFNNTCSDCTMQDIDGYGLDNSDVLPPPISYGVGGLTQGERFICYMCYETHNTPTDPLVAPCECRGDTRYLHVQCLQKFMTAETDKRPNSALTLGGPVLVSHVIRTNGCAASVSCKICGSHYKSSFIGSDGRKHNLLEKDSHTGAYICLTVVTRHENSPDLFNARFKLCFPNPIETLASTIAQIRPGNRDPNSILIGRSSACNMVLDYRTVSTIHAIATFNDGKFLIRDNESSNGTMRYLRSPLHMDYNSTYRIKMGRTTITLTPQRSLLSAVRGSFTSSISRVIQRKKVASTSTSFVGEVNDLNPDLRFDTLGMSNEGANALERGDDYLSGHESTSSISSSLGSTPTNSNKNSSQPILNLNSNTVPGAGTNRDVVPVAVTVGPVRTFLTDLELMVLMATYSESEGGAPGSPSSKEKEKNTYIVSPTTRGGGGENNRRSSPGLGVAGSNNNNNNDNKNDNNNDNNNANNNNNNNNNNANNNDNDNSNVNANGNTNISYNSSNLNFNGTSPSYPSPLHISQQVLSLETEIAWWYCKACTFINDDMTTSKCGVCETQRQLLHTHISSPPIPSSIKGQDACTCSSSADLSDRNESGLSSKLRESASSNQESLAFITCDASTAPVAITTYDLRQQEQEQEQEEENCDDVDIRELSSSRNDTARFEDKGCFSGGYSQATTSDGAGSNVRVGVCQSDHDEENDKVYRP